MSFGLHNTLVFLILILLGVFLQKKINKPEEKKGIKAIILNLALPATIFIALLKIEVDQSAILFPVLALALNAIMLLGAFAITNVMNVSGGSKTQRSILLLFPSFAPGLSCFPFLIEFLGDEALASAALADIGNKIFVLIVLYMIAMSWYYRRKSDALREGSKTSTKSKLKNLSIVLLKEPINMILVVALLMLSFGLTFSSFPVFVQESISRLSLMMTPLILVFIGMSLSVSKRDISFIVQLLLWRSGLAFILSAALIMILPSEVSVVSKILIVVFPQSAVSFWPFAHMSAIDNMEKADGGNRTFDLSLSLNILAFSLPMSTMIILGICSNVDSFVNPLTSFTYGITALILAIIPVVYKYFRNLSTTKTTVLQKEMEAKG